MCDRAELHNVSKNASALWTSRLKTSIARWTSCKKSRIVVSEPLELTCQTIEITNEDDFEPSVEQIIRELHQM